MSKELEEFIKNDLNGKCFDLFRRGQKIPLNCILYLGLVNTFQESFHALLRNIPGPLGMKIRDIFYRQWFSEVGKNCIFSEGIYFKGARNIYIGDYVWIDRDVSISAQIGNVKIGSRVHIAPSSHISGEGGVEIGDFVGISSGVKIYSHSESPRGGLRISGPMIPEKYKGMKTKKIIIEKDAFLGANSVVLPGVHIGEGAVIAANSLVMTRVKPYTIVAGVPAKKFGERSPVNVPDIYE